MKQISSSFTLLYKLLSLSVLLLILVPVIVNMTDIVDYMINDYDWFENPIFYILMLPLLYLSFMNYKILRLKKIEIGDNSIFVTGLSRTIEIAFENIKDVDQDQALSIEIFHINLHKKSEFGKRILFTTGIRLNRHRVSNPVLEDLESRIKSCKKN